MIIPNIWENKKCSKPPTKWCLGSWIWTENGMEKLKERSKLNAEFCEVDFWRLSRERNTFGNLTFRIWTLNLQNFLATLFTRPILSYYYVYPYVPTIDPTYLEQALHDRKTKRRADQANREIQMYWNCLSNHVQPISRKGLHGLPHWWLKKTSHGKSTDNWWIPMLNLAEAFGSQAPQFSLCKPTRRTSKLCRRKEPATKGTGHERNRPRSLV